MTDGSPTTRVNDIHRSLERVEQRLDEIQKEIANIVHLQLQMNRIEARVELIRETVSDVSLAHGERIARLETRQGIMAILSAAASALAGWIGVKN